MQGGDWPSPWREALAFLALYGTISVPLVWLPAGVFALTVASVVLAGILSLLSAIDLLRYRLPDELTLPLTAAGVGVAWWSQAMPVWWSLASAVLGYGLLAGVAHLYERWRGRAGLGLGDAKLLAASGAWVGAAALPSVLLWATASALACVMVAKASGRPLTPVTRLPFGPFLAFGTWLVWLYGPL